MGREKLKPNFKAMTLRLPKPMAREIEIVAEVDGMPVSRAIAKGIQAHIRERQADEEFRKRRVKMVAENLEILKRLAN